MTATLDTADAFLWNAIAADETDDAPKLILADWYAERGDAELEAGLREAVSEGYWPHDTLLGFVFWQGHQSEPLYIGLTNKFKRCILPFSFDDEGTKRLAFPSLPDAIRWLGGRVLEGR